MQKPILAVPIRLYRVASALMGLNSVYIMQAGEPLLVPMQESKGIRPVMEIRVVGGLHGCTMRTASASMCFVPCRMVGAAQLARL